MTTWKERQELLTQYSRGQISFAELKDKLAELNEADYAGL